MKSKVRIILGILLVSLTGYQVECASLHHIRSVRDVELPVSLNASVTNTTVTSKDVITSTTVPVIQSSPSPQEISKNVNKIESKSEDLTENESVKSSVEDTITSPKEKATGARGSVKFLGVNQPETKKETKENQTKENQTKESKENVNKNDDSKETTKNETKESEDEINKNDEPKATGRSLNIDIEKYVSPDFHNKNNVYSLPTSPEIEKYMESDSEDFSEDVTKPPKRTFTSRSTNNDYNFDLTTPQSNIFDPKFQMLVDGIKQNLDELSAVTNHDEDDKKSTTGNDTSSNYDVSKLIDNHKNADNETDVSLQTKEYRNIDIHADKNNGNKDVESGKNVNYESTNLKTRTYGEKTSNSTESLQSVTTTLKPTSTTFVPSKKPRFQTSLRNNTIETTASDSEVKPKSIKHFTYESSSLDPLFEAKPTHENAINISKRGSTKFVDTTVELKTSTTPSFMDFDNKNFSIPPTATAWTLVTLKDVPATTKGDSNEQNSQENNLIKVRFTPTTKKETTENDLSSTTKFYRIASSSRSFFTSTANNKDNKDATDAYDEDSSSTEEDTTNSEDLTENEATTTEKEATTTENITSTVSNELSTTDSLQSSSQNDDVTSETDETTEHTTFNFISTTINDLTTTENMNKYTTTTDFTTTESSDGSTIEPDTTQTTETEQQENTTEFSDYYDTTIIVFNEQSTTESASSTNGIKLISSKTESENELYTTIKPVSNNVNTTSSPNPNVSTEQSITTTKFQRISTSSSSHVEPEEDNFDDDYSDVIKKEKNTTDANDPDTEIVPIPIDNAEGSHRTSTPKKLNETTTPISIYKDQKSILASDPENTTADTTSSTDMLSHEDSPEENNSGMIAAIVISSVGAVCLIALAGLLLIMRKRQKRVTYGQRCRPVSLDAYSLDNVSVYNSVRRKGALRASKRSYGNPAFDDPVSISHQMNFQALVKFAENVEDMSNEFDEVPQVTARANEVPPGCETKNRYANVIPLPETRVFLKPSDNDPHSDYINANYVTGPKNTRGYYIACQAPMQNTVDDFWRMIWEQQCRVVLMLTNLYENGIEKCADYLPPSEVLDCHRLFGDFQITLKKREVKEKYIISSLQLKNMVSNSWREVTHLWYLGWPERGVPTETNSLIAFLIEARSHLKTASNNNSSNDKTSESSNIYISNAAGPGGGTPDGGPMVMHCSPGTGRTGTVIACDIAIRDFELTRAVDVPKIVYRVRRDRALAVQTRDQYAFIYKVISLYATKLTGGALDSI